MSLLKVFSNHKDKAYQNIILLHGYGANGQDLAGLAEYSPLSQLPLNWYFLEAPLSPPELMMFGGKAWFNLRVSEFADQMQKGNFEMFYQMENSDFKQSLELINNTIWSLELDKEPIIGGFSQGAMMAANGFFDSPSSYQGLVLLSGAPFNYGKWKSLESPAPVFLSHGEQDPVLPIQCGLDLKAKLIEKKALLKESFFKGGHEIPASVLNHLSTYLKNLLNGAA